MLRTTDLDALRQSWKVYERITSAKPYPSAQGLEPVIRLVAARNPPALYAKPAQFFDTRLIEQIDKSGFIDRIYRQAMGRVAISANWSSRNREFFSSRLPPPPRCISRAWNR